MPAEPKALVLDLDGTLVESLPDLAASVNELLGELGRPALADAEIAAMIGDGARKLVARALAARGIAGEEIESAQSRFLEIYEARPAALSRPYPGAAATLGRLAASGWRLALCTNKPMRATRIMLRTLDLERFFGATIAGDSLPVRKPDPAPLLAALQALGVSPARGIAVGDHANDLLAAAAAGIPAIWADYGYGTLEPRLPPPAAVIRVFSELAPAAARLLPA
ncbi:MAG TPA: phosphoglycolate phosphatase [Stellaceae bacterium]|nr:phosphoglycolate phosphatase [Stellaceae bacterium]